MDFKQGGQAIQRIRKERGMTQEQLAEITDVASNLHIPDREPRLHGVLAPPCRKGAPLFHEQF